MLIADEIVVEAPIEVVWRVVTNPELMTGWFADVVDLVIEPGARGRLRFGDQGGPVVVEEVEPPSRFTFRWNHPEGSEPLAGNSMLVAFTLAAEGPERTRVRVVESGHELTAWPDAEKQRYADEHREGWAEFLARLAGVVLP
nr:SRPBCC domain-containing protein [Kribbella sandramycini]